MSRRRDAITKTPSLTGALKLCKTMSRGSVSYALETYLRSQYLYNSLILEGTQKLQEVDNAICTNLFLGVLNCREGALTQKAVSRLYILFHAAPGMAGAERFSQLHTETEEVSSRGRKRVRQKLGQSHQTFCTDPVADRKTESTAIHQKGPRTENNSSAMEKKSSHHVERKLTERRHDKQTNSKGRMGQEISTVDFNKPERQAQGSTIEIPHLPLPRRKDGRKSPQRRVARIGQPH